MKRKTVSGIMLTLLFIGMLTFAFNIQQVKSDWAFTESIYIRADGSVEPDTAPISSADNITYTLTDNIGPGGGPRRGVIVVERDNIVVDGENYSIHLRTGGIGINMTGRSNVTITNMTMWEIGTGIHLSGSNNNILCGNSFCCYIDDYSISLIDSSNNTISGNNIRDSGVPEGGGIRLINSSNNTISGNNVTDNSTFGICLSGSSNNTISGNNITNNRVGIWLKDSSNNNSIAMNEFVNDGLLVYNSYGNEVESNLVNDKPLIYLEGVSDYLIENAGQLILINCSGIRVKNLDLHGRTTVGVELWGTNNTKISGNNITDNRCAIMLNESFSTTVSGNNIINNYGRGICLSESFNNTISRNNITDNHRGICLRYSFNNTISRNNITDNGHSGIFLRYSFNNTISRNNITDNSVGIFLRYSFNNTISRNNIMRVPNNYGIWLFESSDNTISGNNVTDNYIGIFLRYSFNNTISRNDIINNDIGIWLFESSDNYIYHNNLIGNTEQVRIESYPNTWDDGYPSGGNYWSNHVCAGNPSDGSQPYIMDPDNIDHYPFQDPNGWHLRIGDIDFDGIVDITDVLIAALAFGSQTGDPNWDERTDLNNDGITNIFDLVIVGVNFGKRLPQ